jgi:hypothetical protein
MLEWMRFCSEDLVFLRLASGRIKSFLHITSTAHVLTRLEVIVTSVDACQWKAM